MIEVEMKKYENSIVYYIKGTTTLHREDGPALTDELGEDWFYKGDLHRDGGPAVERKDGTKEWYINGRLHREDDPAVIYGDGDLEWCLNGTFFESKEEWFEALTESQKEKALYSEYFMRG